MNSLHQRFFLCAAGISESRLIFGCRPKARTAKPREISSRLSALVTIKTCQKTETVLEKSLAPSIILAKGKKVFLEEPSGADPENSERGGWETVPDSCQI